MKYTNIRAFEKHLKEACFSSSASNSHFSSLYLLVVIDDFERRQAVNHLVLSLLKGEGCSSSSFVNEYNKKVFQGGKDKAKTVLHELYSLSLFAKKRVILLEKGEELSKEDMTLLEECFSRLPPNVYFVICASAIHRSTRFYKQAEKMGVILDVEPEKSWEKEASLKQKVTEVVKSEGKEIDPSIAQEFVKYVGEGDTATLFQELEKLLCYMGERNQITKKDLQAICIGKNSQTVWQLGEALFARRGAEALMIAHQLLEEGEPLFGLLRQLRSQFQSHFLVATEPGDEVLKRYPYLRGSLLQKQLQQAKQFGVKACKKALILIDETELEAKNSSLSHELLIEKLFFKLTLLRIP